MTTTVPDSFPVRPSVTRPNPTTSTPTLTGRRHGLPVYATAYITAGKPCSKRKRWTGWVRCPDCGGAFTIFAPERIGLTGVRKLGCGDRAWLVIARTISAREVPDVAAA